MMFRWVIGIALGLVTVLVVIFYLTRVEHPVPATVAHDSTLPRVTIDGVTYHSETLGDAANPVVIAIHGGPGGDYRSILSLRELSDEFYVVFFDQRGAGLSPRVDAEQITIESAIADLDSIVDHFGAGKPVNLVAHSWGAMLASAYLGQHGEKVDHAVFAEPGFFTSEYANKWAEQTTLKFSPAVVYHFLKTKIESLHVRGPDDDAAADYFSKHINLYQGDDHPQAGYRCPGVRTSANGSWRSGSRAHAALLREVMDADGKFVIDLTKGVSNFTNRILFLTGECQKIIGADWQEKQMTLFPNAELAVVPDAGHEMFAENPEASLAVVRAYLNTKVDQ